MSWVLIVLLYSDYGGKQELDHVTVEGFKTNQACLVAAQVIRTSLQKRVRAQSFCVKK